jgi:SnoaL-like domain
MAWRPETTGEENMAQDNRFDPARLERIERRLQVLEDAEAIRNLKARYAALCDNQYDADGIASLFTEDAIWESPALDLRPGFASERRDARRSCDCRAARHDGRHRSRCNRRRRWPGQSGNLGR